MRQQISDMFPKLRTCYIALCIVYFNLIIVVPIGDKLIAHAPQLSLILGILGSLLLAIDFFTKRRMFQVPSASILVLFFIFVLLSCVLNYRYALMNNLKSLIWMAIFTFIFAAIDRERPMEMQRKELYFFFDLVILLSFLPVLWSLGQYVVQYGAVVDGIMRRSGEATIKFQGFMRNRLFGVFNDPNLAAVRSLWAIAAAAICTLGRKNIASKIYYIITIIAEIFYVLLSGSRGTMLAVYVSAAFLTFFLGWQISKNGVFKRFLTGIALAVVCVFGLMAAFNVLKEGLSYIPEVYADLTAPEPPIHSVDDPQDTPDISQGPQDPNQRPSPDEPVDFNRTDNAAASSDMRKSFWRDYLRIIKSAPLLGATPNGIFQYAESHFVGLSIITFGGSSAHNGFITLFATTGLLGGCTMMFWIFRMAFIALGALLRRWNNRDSDYWVLLILVVMSVGMLTATCTLSLIFFSLDPSDIILWFSLGHLLYLVEKMEPQRFREPKIQSYINHILPRTK